MYGQCVPEPHADARHAKRRTQRGTGVANLTHPRQRPAANLISGGELGTAAGAPLDDGASARRGRRAGGQRARRGPGRAIAGAAARAPPQLWSADPVCNLRTPAAVGCPQQGLKGTRHICHGLRC